MYLPKACWNPAWNSLRQPGLSGVRPREEQASNGFRTGLAHPVLDRIRFSLNGRFHGARVGDAQNGIAGLDVVGDTQARLGFADGWSGRCRGRREFRG